VDQGPLHKTRYTETNRIESGEEPWTHRHKKFFLKRTLNASAIWSSIDKWDLIKLQRFCKAKDTVNRTKQQTTDLEKIFKNPTSYRGLISDIYKIPRSSFIVEDSFHYPGVFVILNEFASCFF